MIDALIQIWKREQREAQYGLDSSYDYYLEDGGFLTPDGWEGYEAREEELKYRLIVANEMLERLTNFTS